MEMLKNKRFILYPFLCRSFESGNKLVQPNGMLLPPSFPSLSLLPPSVGAGYLHGRKPMIESNFNLQTELKSTEMEQGMLKQPTSSSIAMGTSANSSLIPLVSRETDGNSNSDSLTSSLQRQPTRIDSALSFGMARLLGEVQKKCEYGKKY
jgi:hypothetical protein